VCKHIVEHHRRMRRFLPLLMDTIAFEGTDAAKPVIDAWNGLRALEGRKVLQESHVELAFVSTKWKPFVVESPGVVNREAYTMCVLERLCHGLRRREIFAPRSKKWGDPRSYLLPDSAWPAERPKVCRSLNLPATPEPFIDLLRAEVDASYHLAADRFEENDALRIEEKDDLEKFVLRPLEAVDDPESLKILRSQVDALMPHIDLPDVLLEVNAWSRFADEFTHISEGRARVENISTSICAVLLAEACNVGLEPVVRHGSSALTRGRLSWVTQNYVRADTLRRANARLVNYQATIPLAKQWGGGAVATVDGIRFVVPVRTINAGPNPKYFDVRRGVTYFNYGSDQFTGFHSIVIPGTMRDSLFILSGLLEQETNLRPKELISDNAGYSDLVFGLFRVLGYQFSPRIADLGDARLWRFDRDANYGRLDGIARNYISPEIIASKWDAHLARRRFAFLRARAGPRTHARSSSGWPPHRPRPRDRRNRQVPEDGPSPALRRRRDVPATDEGALEPPRRTPRPLAGGLSRPTWRTPAALSRRTRGSTWRARPRREHHCLVEHALHERGAAPPSRERRGGSPAGRRAAVDAPRQRRWAHRDAAR